MLGWSSKSGLGKNCGVLCETCLVPVSHANAARNSPGEFIFSLSPGPTIDGNRARESIAAIPVVNRKIMTASVASAGHRKSPLRRALLSALAINA